MPISRAKFIRWSVTIAAFVPFIYLLAHYIEIPTYQSWNDVERFLQRREKSGAQILFCPSYLANYAQESHGGRFRNFTILDAPSPETSLYDHYWLIGTCRAPEGADTKTFSNGIRAHKVTYENYEPYNTFLTRDFKRGRVTVQRKNRSWSCPIDGDELVCGQPHWERVKLVNIMVDGEPRTCLFAHPHPDAKLVFEYDELPAGELRFGLEDFGANDARNKAPIVVHVNKNRLFIDHEHRSRTQDFPGGPLRIEISASNTRRRHLCFNLLYGESD